MNHYPRHIGDITRDTFGLSPTEFGCYDRLLDAYYATERPLPLDRREHYRTTGCRTASDRKACDYVLHRYFTQEADGWHQKRADHELALHAERVALAQYNGRSGGRPRKPRETEMVISGNPQETESVISGFQNETQTKASLKPLAFNHNKERSELHTSEVRQETASPPLKGMARHDKAKGRAAVASGIFGDNDDRKQEPTDITSEAKRLA